MVMNSWLVWTVFAAVAVMLGAVGYHFSLRTLRWVTFTVALATAVYLIVYGLTHPPSKKSSLSDDFAWGADALSGLARKFVGGQAQAVGSLR